MQSVDPLGYKPQVMRQGSWLNQRDMVLHSCFKFCLAVCGFLFDVPLELGADALQVFEQKLAGFGLHEITVCFAV